MATVALDISVLHATSRVRGIGRYVYDLARGLHTLAPSTPRVVGLELTAFTGKATLHPQLGPAAERLRNGGTPMISHARWAYRQRFGLARAARRAQLALLHTGHPEATPLAWGRHVRRVTTCHDLIPFRYPQFYIGWRDGFAAGRKRIDARRYRRADHIIAVSRASADDLMRLLDIAAAHISVVLNGVDVSSWSAIPTPDDAALRARLGADEGPYLLYVGAADWR
ncbi:MAG TPA: hypothetical protein ENK23_01110, partial [Sorangium sp.]|nr:hypothetical protein [Sorangium sp.]